MKQKDGSLGIYLLPNLLTTGSLFAAFYAIVASMKGQYEAAIVAIFIAMIADTLDGRIARLLNTQTAFGAEYDSLSDMVTFGVAPSLLLYSLSLHTLGKIGWLLAFFYTASVALRLARFNVCHSSDDKRFFRGLPCPPAAAVILSFTWLHLDYHLTLFSPLILGSLAAVLALLMVSSLPYYSFKQVDFRRKVPFLYPLIIVLIFVAVAANPAVVLFACSFIYALSAPVCYLWRKKKRLG